MSTDPSRKSIAGSVAKFSQADPRTFKRIQGKKKGFQGEKTWIFLDSFVRFGTFQWVVAIPKQIAAPRVDLIRTVIASGAAAGRSRGA
jgi:hypothetical protein